MTHADRLRRSADAFRRLTGLAPAAFDRWLGELEPRYWAADARWKARPGRRRKPGAGGRAEAYPGLGRPPARAPDLLPYLHHPRRPRVPVRDRRLGRRPERQPPATAPGRGAACPSGGSPWSRRTCGNPFSTPPSGRSRGRPRGRSGSTAGLSAAHPQDPSCRGPAAEAARPRGHTPMGAGRRGAPDAPRDDPRQAGLRPDAGGVPAGGVADRGHRVPGDRVGDAAAEAPEGRAARPKAGNRRGPRRRIVVEHGIGKMKMWRIAAERDRNPRRRHTRVTKNVAGRHNLMVA